MSNVQQQRRIEANRVTQDCFAMLVRGFIDSPKFRKYSDNTKALWTRELNFAARPDCLGTISIQEIRPSLVQAFLDGLEDRPGKQDASLAALRVLEKWAVVRDLLPRQITLGVETEGSDGGHIPWTNEHVAIALEHARPDMAKAILLAANTGQRGSDLVRIGPTDIETFDGVSGISLVQIKTKREQWIPITATLADAMEGWTRTPGPFLRRPDNHAFTRPELTKTWAYERDTNPHLAKHKELGLVMHGLRGHACVSLLRAGCNTRQIADMVGMSEKTVLRYTRLSSQRQNATAAVHLLERTRREQNVKTFHKSGL